MPRRTLTTLVGAAILALHIMGQTGALPDCHEDEAVILVVANHEGRPSTFETGAANPLPAGHAGCAPWDDIDAGYRP